MLQKSKLGRLLDRCCELQDACNLLIFRIWLVKDETLLQSLRVICKTLDFSASVGFAYL